MVFFLLSLSLVLYVFFSFLSLYFIFSTFSSFFLHFFYILFLSLLYFQMFISFPSFLISFFPVFLFSFSVFLINVFTPFNNRDNNVFKHTAIKKKLKYTKKILYPAFSLSSVDRMMDDGRNRLKPFILFLFVFTLIV